MPGGAIGAVSIGDLFGKAFGQKGKPRRMLVREAYDPLVAEESDKLLDNDAIVQEAIREVENNGIVFLDEIDKICAREAAPARMSAARVCSAISCRSSRAPRSRQSTAR